MNQPKKLVSTTILSALVGVALLACGRKPPEKVVENSPPASAVPGSRYLISKDLREVTDTQTKLVWQRYVHGMRFLMGACIRDAVSYSPEEAQALLGREGGGEEGWRLPTSQEMTTLFVHRYAQPEMKLEIDTDMEVFPGPSLGDKVYHWAKLQAAGEAMTVYGFYLFEDRLLSHTQR